MLAGIHFALVALAFVVAPRGIAVIGVIAVLGFSAFIQLISGHNAMHAPLFFSRRAQRCWQVVLSLTFSYPVSAFVPVHNLSHHKHLQTPKDVLRTTEVRHRSNLLNLLHHVVASTIHIHVLNATYVRAMARRRSVWFAQVRVELIAVLVVGAVILALSPRAFLLFVLAPSFVGQSMIIGLGYLQHDGCDADTKLHHSRNFLSPIFNWLIFNNGYHSIHHMQPGLHWSLAVAAHREHVAPHIHPALDQRSIVAYMWRTYVWPGRRLRFDGRPVTFASDPVPRSTEIVGIARAVEAVEG